MCFLLFCQAQGQDFVHYQNPFGDPWYIDVAPDGIVWFKSGAHLVQLDPASESLTRFKLPTDFLGLVGVDADGAVWVFCGDVICRVSDGQTGLFLLPDGFGSAMACAPDGSVWVGMYLRQRGEHVLLRYAGDGWNEVIDVALESGVRAM